MNQWEKWIDDHFTILVFITIGLLATSPFVVMALAGWRF